MTQDFNHEKHQMMKLHNEYWILFFAKTRGKEQSKGLKEETMSTGNQALPKLPKWPWKSNIAAKTGNEARSKAKQKIMQQKRQT